MVSPANNVVYLDLTVGSQDPTANTSTIHWRVRVYINYGVNANHSGNAYVNGNLVWNYAGNPGNMVSTGTYTLAEGDIALAHDGSGNLGVSGSAHVQTVSQSSAWSYSKDATGSVAVPSLARAPGAPGLSVGTISATSAVVTVTEAAPNGAVVTAYVVDVATDAAFASVVKTWGGGSGTATDLTRAGHYYVRTRAHNAVSDGPYAYAEFDTLPTAPGAPTWPATPTSDIATTSLTVTWTAPADNGGRAITGHVVQVSQTSNFSAIVGTFSSGAITGLAPGGTYSVRVAEVNSAGTGPWSATLTVTSQAGIFEKVAAGWVAGTLYEKVSPTSWAPIAYAMEKMSGGWAQ